MLRAATGNGANITDALKAVPPMLLRPLFGSGLPSGESFDGPACSGSHSPRYPSVLSKRWLCSNH